MGTTVYATFIDAANAEKAAGALLDYGVRPEDVSMVRKHEPQGDLPDVAQSNRGMDAEPAYAPGSSAASDEKYDNLTAYDAKPQDRDPEEAAKQGITTTTPQDAGAGAIKGAGVGLGVGAVAALAALFVPGFGLIVGGGALAAALGGALATTGAGAVAGAVTGYLKDQGMDSAIAADYERSVLDGGALISVAVPSGQVDESTVRSILSKYGAENVYDFAGRGSGGYVA